jgi:voltage-gated sodium channel
MSKTQELAKRLVDAPKFDWFITAIILLNCVVIGVETYFVTDFTNLLQEIIVGIFTLEIVLRWQASANVKAFFSDGWNIFDLFIVIVSLVPESVFSSADLITTLRVLRVFRVLRLLSTVDELRLIISVLVKSFSALTYNTIIFFIFLYLFAVTGVTIFRLPTQQAASDPKIAELLKQHSQVAPNSPNCSPEPYGSLDEAMFTLFRVLTGEDWTDVRYNLLVASDLGLITPSATVVTLFHVFWYVISAFLLLNLLVGAILNNYSILMDEHRKKREEAEQAQAAAREGEEQA